MFKPFCDILIIAKNIREPLRFPREGFFYAPKGDVGRAEETETRLPIPRLPEIDEWRVLRGTRKADERTLQ